MERIERSGASVEEAIELALAELGISEQHADIQVLREPKSGFLGLNAQPAVVSVAPRTDQKPSEDDQELIEDQADAAADLLEGLLEAMRIDADVEINTAHRATYVEIWPDPSSDDVGLLIGKRGATLEGLQEVARACVQRSMGWPFRILVDVEDYRKRRREQIVRRARATARQVLRSGRPERLEPMSAYDRKVVHDTVGELGGLETASEGQDPNRYVVIRKH
ncbi:hypothetical protein BH20ACT24_BH20ACT24_03610 [soil metagenome]